MRFALVHRLIAHKAMIVKGNKNARRISTGKFTSVVITVWLAATAQSILAQSVKQSVAGENAARAERQSLVPKDYNIKVGDVGIRAEAHLGLEYNDNVYWTPRPAESDFIIHPEVRLRSHWQVTKVNTITLGVGIGYDYYCQHDDLNSSRPLISPDTALTFKLYTGDVKIDFHDRFSYQESLSYGSYLYDNGVFLNVSGVGILGRYDNMGGVQVDWDLNEILLTFNYDHDEFWVTDPVYNYADRSSEFFKAMATFRFSPQLQAGLEGNASFNHYHTGYNPDYWLVGIGPFVAWSVTPRLNFRFGGGYVTTFSDASDFNSGNFDNYYIYGQINHRLSSRITHSLMAGHRNDIGFNGYNIAQTSFQYNINWSINRRLDVGAFGWVYDAEEHGITYTEAYIYWSAGVNAGYQLAERWRATASYIYTEKLSDYDFREFYRNQLQLGMTYRF
jgi:hypothetical protein